MTITVRPWLWCLAAVAGISALAISAQPRSETRSLPLKIEGVPVADILQRLGAQLERETSRRALDGYTNQFDRTDPDRDGKHTREEYVEKGRYLTPQARAGIFRAADGDRDGVVTRAEYILNRIITDEAKELVSRMDDDRDGLVERTEFVKHATKRFDDVKLAEKVFSVFDSNSDGVIYVPEYLRVWGQWARSGRDPAEKRIAARRAELGDTPGQPGSRKSDRRGPPERSAGNRAGSRNNRTGRFTPFGRPGSRFGGGPPDPEQFVERAMKFDADKDGKLDRQELRKLAEDINSRGSERGGGRFGSRQGGRSGSRRTGRPPGR